MPPLSIYYIFGRRIPLIHSTYYNVSILPKNADFVFRYCQKWPKCSRAAIFLLADAFRSPHYGDITPQECKAECVERSNGIWKFLFQAIVEVYSDHRAGDRVSNDLWMSRRVGCIYSQLYMGMQYVLKVTCTYRRSTFRRKLETAKRVGFEQN